MEKLLQGIVISILAMALGFALCWLLQVKPRQLRAREADQQLIRLQTDAEAASIMVRGVPGAGDGLSDSYDAIAHNAGLIRQTLDAD